jgi:hypothetical protein
MASFKESFVSFICNYIPTFLVPDGFCPNLAAIRAEMDKVAKIGEAMGQPLGGPGLEDDDNLLEHDLKYEIDAREQKLREVFGSTDSKVEGALAEAGLEAERLEAKADLHELEAEKLEAEAVEAAAAAAVAVAAEAAAEGLPEEDQESAKVTTALAALAAVAAATAADDEAKTSDWRWDVPMRYSQDSTDSDVEDSTDEVEYRDLNDEEEAGLAKLEEEQLEAEAVEAAAAAAVAVAAEEEGDSTRLKDLARLDVVPEAPRQRMRREERYTPPSCMMMKTVKERMMRRRTR